MRFDNSLLVGELPGENSCTVSAPPYRVPAASFHHGSAKGGIMMSTFSKSRGKMSGLAPWHKRKELLLPVLLSGALLYN